MAAGETPTSSGAEETRLPPANIGNASNPSPHQESLTPAEGAQLLNEKAEKYLREVASIEDVPDAQDQEEMDENLSEGK
jgi:hypothetical protein